jgi:hypothetical protein
MKYIEVIHPYLTGIHGASPHKPGSDAIIMHAWNDFYCRLIQLKMLLQEFQYHTSKIDKRMYLTSLDKTIRIPAIMITKDTKEKLKRNRFQVERMVSQLGIIMLVSALEYSCREFCEALRKKNKLKNHWDELKGDPLSRFKIYFEKYGHLHLDISNEDWQYMKSIVRLRNTFAHSLGEIREEDRKTLEKLASDNKGLLIKDGYVYANMEFTYDTIDRIQRCICVCVGRIGHPEIDIIMSKVRKLRPKNI